MSHDLTDIYLTSIQVITWCRQRTITVFDNHIIEKLRTKEIQNTHMFSILFANFLADKKLDMNYDISLLQFICN